MVIDEKLLYSIGAKIKQYYPAEVIFEQGDSPFFYFQILEGNIKLNNYDEEGKEFIQNILGPGQSFGESILFGDHTYPMNAVAINKCTVLKVNKNNFFALLEQHPKISMDLNKHLSERLYYKYIMLQNNSSKNPVKRLTGLLNYLKSFQKCKTPFSFQVPLTRQQMACLTGLCTETAIRVLKSMEKDNVVQIKDRKVLY